MGTFSGIGSNGRRSGSPIVAGQVALEEFSFGVRGQHEKGRPKTNSLEIWTSWPLCFEITISQFVHCITNYICDHMPTIVKRWIVCEFTSWPPPSLPGTPQGSPLRGAMDYHFSASSAGSRPSGRGMLPTLTKMGRREGEWLSVKWVMNTHTHTQWLPFKALARRTVPWTTWCWGTGYQQEKQLHPTPPWNCE